MSGLSDLPTELVTITGSFLHANDVCSFRLINKELSAKLSRSFYLLFKTVKISLIRISIQELSDAVWHEKIGNEVEHLIIGTGTLEQYRCAPTSLPNAFCNMLAREGNWYQWRTWLQNIVIQKLPNLRTITIEDRPEDPTSTLYRPSMGSAGIMRTVGVDLRWNGPYNATHLIPYNPERLLPRKSRSSAYTLVFDMLRYLDIHDTVLDLEIIVRGHRVMLDESFHIIAAFDVAKQSIRDILDSYLTKITIGENAPICIDQQQQGGLILQEIYQHVLLEWTEFE